MVEEGDKAPDFRLRGSDGKLHTLKDFKGKYLILYFYPKDNTPGCTLEANEFNKNLDDIRKFGAEIVGISKDDLNSHDKFRDKYKLHFLLLADPESKVIKSYDAYGNRGVFGMGTLRNTYIIDGEGTVVKVFKKVNPKGHANEVMNFLRNSR
ncbi:MAG: peroxiredoxin [Candidatus Micrarchaeia archaeon]